MSQGVWAASRLGNSIQMIASKEMRTLLRQQQETGFFQKPNEQGNELPLESSERNEALPRS